MSKVRCKVTSYRLPFPPATNLYALVFSPPLTNRDASPTLSRGDIFSPPPRIDRKLNFHSTLHIAAPSFPVHTYQSADTAFFAAVAAYFQILTLSLRENAQKSPQISSCDEGGGRKRTPIFGRESCDTQSLGRDKPRKKRRSMPHFFSFSFWESHASRSLGLSSLPRRMSPSFLLSLLRRPAGALSILDPVATSTP